MKTIWKIILIPDNLYDIPAGAEVLSVHVQRGNICLWMKVDAAAVLESRRFTVYRTGEELPEEWMDHLGTVFLDEMVFHVFERK